MAKFDHFNIIGPMYDWIFSGRNSLKLLEFVDLKPQHILLDIGGGTGRVSICFLKITNSIIVADLAIKMLQEAHKKGLSTINTVSEKLPFQNECFDRVIMVDAFHHVISQQQTLDEIWRTLKPGGRLVIEEPNIHYLFPKIIALTEKLLFMRSKFFSPEEIIAMSVYEDIANIQLFEKNNLAWIVIDKNTCV